MAQHHDVIVIGCGITGLNAARHALRSGMTTAVVEGQFVGGLVLNINHLDGEFSGSGMDHATDLMSEILDLGAVSVSATTTAIRHEGQRLVAVTDAGEFAGRAIIVASGARLKRLGIPGEAELEERGVSRCADCDGPLYQNQDVVVVGGGDSALQEALVLAQFARKVHLVHRGAHFRARAHLVEQVAAARNIETLWRTQVLNVLGDQSVQAVRLRKLDDATTRDIACAGFFAYVGLEPASEFVPAAALRDPSGFLLTDTHMRTGLAGLFAAGAVRAGYAGLLSHAVAEGIAAADAAIAGLRSQVMRTA